ncbi:integrator complex assembly factor WDR73 [Polymixia lowei]
MDAVNETEETHFDDILDDWFIESLKTYKDLHVYHLEHSTRVIEWTSGKTVCVAGYHAAKNDILELHLPPKLFADENKGLCAERDFKVVNGGFTDGPVHCLTHIPGTRCVVTNDGLSSRLEVWHLGVDDTDVIRRTGSTDPGTVSERGSRVAAGLTSEPSVLHGGLLNQIQLTDLSSGKTLYKLESDTADPLSSLQFVSDGVFLACCCNGDLYLVDTRTSSLPPPAPAQPAAPVPAGVRDAVHWCMDASADRCSLDPGRRGVVRLSSSGEAVVSDLRDVGTPVCRARLGLRTDGSNRVLTKVSWAPALDGCIAVSGFNGAVQIYDTSGWTGRSDAGRPLFEHRGHDVSPQHAESGPVFTTSHVWHPSRARTLLSAATDGSVHVWDWVDQTAANG